MSFLTDLFSGNTSNLGNDLSPSNIFSDTQQDIGGKNTIPDLLGGAALLTGGLGLAGAIPGIAGLGVGAADATATGAAGAPLDILGAGGIDAGTTAATAGADALSFAGADAAADTSGLGAINTALGIGGDTASATGTDALSLAAPSATGGTLAAPDAATAAANAGSFDLNTIGAGTDAGNPLNILPSTATTGTSGASGSGGFLNQLVSGASNSLTKNPLGIAVAGGLLGYDVLKGNPNSAAENTLNAQASTLSSQAAQLTGVGQQLTSYLQNGTLPPGQQAAVTQAIQARKAQIIANAAANGQNTNPAQNSGLAQDLSNADMQGLAMAGQLETQLAQTGTQLISTGLNATGLSSEIYQALIKIDQTNNQQLMTAIAGMAAALGGGTKIQIGGTSTAAP
jgi:hypothetical protein